MFLLYTHSTTTLVISGSNIEISKQSKYRNYYGYCYFLERKKFRSKLGARNHKECMSDCFFFEGGVMSYTDYHRSWLQFSWNCKKKKTHHNIYQHLILVKTQLPAFNEWPLLDSHYATFFLHSWSCLVIISLFFKWGNGDLEDLRKGLRPHCEWFLMPGFYASTLHWWENQVRWNQKLSS